ncbi:tudor domain-containing 6-like [Gigantopelta aegis]|uniref:tudor domain-containing 6-like n=1 Tax=Gigantopelta aegis TaxID=1735272 RepID=UPI001B888751|nr:tudor domain-containing 6-like [Gigantopelta aegis]
MYAENRKPEFSGRGSTMRQNSVSRFSQTSLPDGTEEKMVVCHITDPEHFYCHLTKNMPLLNAMMDDIEQYYTSLGADDEQLPQFVLGVACIAQFVEDGGWYRAEITGLLASGLIEVKFVDYGNSESVTSDRIKAIQEKFLQQPILGLKCCLAGVSTHQGYWSPEHIAQFEDVALDQTFTGFVNSSNREGVFMLELTNSKGVNLNKDFGLKTSTVCLDDSKSKSSHRKIMIGQGDAELHVRVMDKNCNHNIEADAADDDKLKNKVALPNGQTGVRATYVLSPSEFWCHLDKDSKRVTTLTDNLNIQYKTLSPKELVVDHPTVGMFCVAKFPDDELWYRGEITAVRAGDCDVYFIDYGNTATVPKGSLKKMLPHLRMESPFAVKCCLSNVKPVSAAWSEEASDEFETLTLDKSVLATVEGRTKGGLMQITLTDTLSGHDIGESLAQQKLAVMVKAGSVGFPKRDVKVPSSCEVYLSSVESPARFWIQLSEKQAQLDELVEKIEGYYSSKGSPVTSVHQGMPVVAKFTEDEAWYRAYVTRSSGGKHDVFFVDFGNSDSVSSAFLKVPTEEILHEPVYAIECSLKGVAPLKQNSNWHPDAKSLLEDVTKDGAVCKFVSVGSTSYVVELNTDGKDVASFLVSSAVVRKNTTDEPSAVRKSGYPNSVSIPAKHLEKGYISQTDSPDSFWAQLSKFTGQLDELMESLEAHYSSGRGVALMGPRVEMPCVAKYSADNAWYRAVIKEIHKSGISVHFVDYGNTEIISPSLVCEIEKQFLDTPMQAVHCKLAVNMKAGTTLETINEKFQEFVLEKELVIKVLSIDGGVLIVDVLDAGQSVIGMLKSEFPSVIISRASTPSGSAMTVDYPPVQVPVGKTKQVYVSFIENPGLFFVHADVDDLLNSIMNKLSNQYASNTEPTLPNPRVGQPCCALYADDGAWYRGKVVSVAGDMIKVQFVDYGNAENVRRNSVKPLSSSHLAVPPLAIQCFMDDVEPMGGTWTDDAVAFMEELTVDKVLMCKFKTSQAVKLFAGDIDVSDKLKEKGFARTRNVAIGQTASIAAAASGPASSLATMKPCALRKQQIPPGSIAAYISHVDANGTFYIQKASDDDSIANLSAELLQYYSSSGSPSSLVQKGTVCCAQFSDDDAWYRAVVEQVSGGCATVRFVDFGNTDISSLKHLKILEPQFCEQPPFAFGCKLENLTSWPYGVQEKFTDYTDNKELDVKFLGSSEPYTVRVTYSGKDLRSQFVFEDAPAEPSSFEMKSPPRPSFGAKPKFGGQEQSSLAAPKSGFGKTSTEQKPSFGRPPAQPSSDEQKPSFGRPAQSSAGETTQKPSFGGRPFGSSAKTPTSPPKKEVEVIPLEEQKFKVSVAPRGQVEAFISHVEEGIIYLQQSKYIESVMATSEKIKKLPDGIAHAAVGYACGAMFTEDKTWYRAEVIEVSDDKVTVRFVDFGNKDTLTMSNMKPLNRELLFQEPKALPCKMVGVDNLTPELVDILAFITADKEILAEFCSHQAPFNVKMKDLEGNDIASILCPTDFPIQETPKELVQCKVVNILSSGVFYVHLTKDMELIRQLKAELEMDFTGVEQTDSPKIEVGHAYCAKSEEDAWQRALVKDVKKDEVEVQLVDLGKSCSLNKSCIFSLHRRFLTFPALSYECILNNFRAWTEEQKEKFVEMTKNKTMNVQFLTKTSPYKVELTRNIALEVLGEPEETEPTLDGGAQESSGGASAVKLPPQTLPDGVTGYASFVDTDGSVYIQLSNEEETLNNITEQLQSDYASGGQAVNPVVLDSTCCAKFTEDDAWYRATITSVSGDQVTVRFVDYGNTDVVSKARIVGLSDQHLQIPALAYHCELHSYRSWTPECVDALDKVVKDQPLTVKVISAGDVFTVELHLDDGSSVAGHLPAPVAEKSKASPYNLIDLEFGKKTAVHISHVESIFTFYVQPVSSDDDLTSLAAAINEHYTADEPGVSVDWMKLGSACVARYTEDEQWYRGIITSVDEKKCGVHFVDYGNADIISKANVHQLKEEYATLPAQAVQCKLSGVDVSDAKLDEASDALLEMTIDKVVSVVGRRKIVEDERDMIVVDVLDGDKNVSATLVESGLCSAVITEDLAEDVFEAESAKETIKETTVEDDSTTSVATDDGSDNVVSKDEECRLADDDVTPATVSSEGLEKTDSNVCNSVSVAEGQRLSVFVSSVESPSRFHIQLDEQKQSLNEMLNAMFDFFNNLAEDEMALENPAVGSLCVVYGGDDESWHRAKIIEVNDDKCILYYVDQGNSDGVECSALKVLPEQFEGLPQQAVVCSLAGIKSSEDAWSDEAVEFFHELIAYKTMLMDVIGFEDRGVCIVNLIHMGTAVTQKMMETGHGMEFSTPVINKKVKRVFSDTNETPVKLVLDEKDESLSDLDDKFEDCAEEVGHIKLRYVPVEMKAGTAYSVFVTRVSDPGTFFCQLTSSAQTFKDLQDDLQAEYAQDSSKLDPDDVAPSMAVVAQNKEEHQFCRAKILSVDKDMVRVSFVDYGQETVVPIADLWKMSPKFVIPVVNVFQCFLACFKPVDDSWTEDATKKFQELTSEKYLVAKVIGQKTSVVAVELVDEFGVSIGQKLVEESLAIADESPRVSVASSQGGDESASRLFGLAVDDSISLGIESINEDTIFGQPLLESTTVVDVSDDQYPLLRIHIEKEYNVDVLEGGTPDSFTIHLLEQASQFKKVKEILSSIDENEEDFEGTTDVGKPCLVKVEDRWYRGKKIEEKDSLSSEVLLVDYAKTEDVDNSDIRKLPNDLLEIPIQALSCTLAHIAPADKIRWSEEAVQFFRDFVGNHQLEVIVTAVSDDHVYSLRMSDGEDLGGISINRQLVDLGFAEPLLGSLIEIELQLEQTQGNSEILDELEISFHEVSYNRNNSYGGDLCYTEDETADEMCHTFNTTGHSFSSILLNDTEDTTKDNTLELVGDTSLLVLPEIVTPLPSTPLPGDPKKDDDDDDDDNADTGTDGKQTVLPEDQQQDANTRDLEDSDGNIDPNNMDSDKKLESVDDDDRDGDIEESAGDGDQSSKEIQDGSEPKTKTDDESRDADDCDGRETLHRDGEGDAVGRSDRVSGEVSDDTDGSDDAEDSLETEQQKEKPDERAAEAGSDGYIQDGPFDEPERDEVLKENGKETSEDEDNDVKSCTEFVESTEDRDGMPSEPKQASVKESELDIVNSAAGGVGVTMSDSRTACARLVSDLVEGASDTMLNTSDDTDLNSEDKDHSKSDAIKSDTNEPCSSSPASEDFCEAREDLSSPDKKSCKDGDVST